MPHFRIQTEGFAGFAAETKTGPGEIRVWTKMDTDSDNPMFFSYLRQFSNIFLKKTSILSDNICKFLIVLHEDNSADIYINDFEEKVYVKLNRPIKKGEYLELKQGDIACIDYPNITINETDGVIYCKKIGWKYSLYYDVTKTFNKKIFGETLARLENKLRFQDIFELSKQLSDEASPTIITEGKTDILHLKAAEKKLDLLTGLKYQEPDKEYGDDQLLRMCENFARTKHNKPIIFIFDRDNINILNKLGKEGNSTTKSGFEYQNWGNNIYSFAIPIPSHRKKFTNISIEFYYKDKELKTKDTLNRRLFFNNEVVRCEGDRKKIFKIPPIKEIKYKKKIFDQDVANIQDKNSQQLALSKSCFAKYVYEGEKGYEKFDFQEFNKIFEVVYTILRKSEKN